MKKKTKIIIIIIAVLVIISSIYLKFSGFTLYRRKNDVYSPEKAIKYSYDYILERNPVYPNFEFNCVTYISQCLLAGGLKMDQVKNEPIKETNVEYNSTRWFCYSYDINPYRPQTFYLSSAFSYYKDFIRYWTIVGKVPSGTVENTEEGRKTLRENIKVGDVIILYGGSDSAHSAMIVEMDEKDIYYNSNTNDRLEYPLSRVQEEVYTKITYLNFVK